MFSGSVFVNKSLRSQRDRSLTGQVTQALQLPQATPVLFSHVHAAVLDMVQTEPNWGVFRASLACRRLCLLPGCLNACYLTHPGLSETFTP